MATASSLENATTLGRVLLGLGRTRMSGALHVDAGAQRGTLWLQQGFVQGASLLGADGPALGDVLQEDNTWDATRHRRALQESVPSRPVGAWLVEHDVSTQAAVGQALRKQLARRLDIMLAWPSPSLELLSTGPDANEEPIDALPLDPPLSVDDLVLQSMRSVVRDVPLARVQRALGANAYRLTPVGEAFVQRATLLPHEAAVVLWLRRGAPVGRLISYSGTGEAGYRFVWLLTLLRAASAPSGSYPLLLRKRRELRRRASAYQLLDLPDDASEPQARRALRQLVRHLHPDRFVPGTPSALRRASSEVVGALLDAEARIAAASRVEPLRGRITPS